MSDGQYFSTVGRADGSPTPTTTYILLPQPQYAGGYSVGGLTISLTTKPSRWHRFWVRVCLGWEWRDA